MKKRKLDYNYVKKYIESKGCKLLENKYINCDTNMLIQCKCGETYRRTFYSFSNRGFTGCKKCKSELLSIASSLPEEVIRKRVEDSGYYLIKAERLGEDQIITVQCNNNHIYKTRLNKFTSGRRCPICKQSQGEYRIESWLKNNNLSYEREYKFDDLLGLGGGKLRFDFCVFQNNKIKILIEYDGKQHFEKTPFMTDNEKIHIHDKFKDEYCKKHNYNLLRINYKQFSQIEKILNQQNIV